MNAPTDQPTEAPQQMRRRLLIATWLPLICTSVAIYAYGPRTLVLAAGFALWALAGTFSAWRASNWNTPLDSPSEDANGEQTAASDSKIETLNHEPRLRDLAAVTNNAWQSSSSANNAVTGVHDSLERVLQASDAMSETTQQVTAAVDVISQSFSQVSEDSDIAVQVAEEASDLVEKSFDTMSELHQSAGLIGNVIDVIQEIAEQTNLLALNATIEAARAGEAGKGFAVVATEVKELASQTARATGDIRSQIEGIQGSTRQAVTSMEAIGEVIEKMNNANHRIHENVQNQRHNTGEVSAKMSQNVAAAQGVAQSVGDSLEACDSLSEKVRAAAHDVLEASESASSLCA